MMFPPRHTPFAATALSLCALWSGVVSAQVSGLSKGQQWFVDNGIQTAGIISHPGAPNTFTLSTYQSMNYTTQTWEWETDPNQLSMSWGRWVSDANNLPGGSGAPAAEATHMNTLRHLNLGTPIGDEPNLNDPAVRDQQVAFFNYAHAQPAFNNVLLWSNNFGGQVNDASLNDFVNRARPDMISFDTYPYAPNAQPLGGSPYNWYSNLRQFRAYALAYNTALGTYRQTYASPGGAPPTRAVSTSELNLQTFAALAFNAKFVHDFTYNFNGGTLFNTPGDSTITALGTADKSMNMQVRRLGPSLTRLKPIPDAAPGDHTTSIMFILGRHWDPSTGKAVFNDMPGYTGFQIDAGSGGAYTDYEFGRNDPYFSGWAIANTGNKNLDPSGNRLKGDVILSWFTPLHEWFDGDDWNDERYLMVVNGLADMNGTTADTTQQISLTFGSSGGVNFPYTYVQRLNRLTGEIENIPVTGTGTKKTLTLTIEGGGAELFKFPDGAPFVGTLPPDAIWQNGSGGAFATGGNWDTGTSPNGNYFAHFGTLTTGAGPYNVTFGGNVASTGAFIHRDNASFNLNGFTYTLNGFAGVDSLIVGMYAGEDARLTLGNGSLNVAASATNFSQVGKAAGASGVVTVGAGGNWINAPTLLIGKAGNGTVNVNASLTASPNGAASFSNVYLGGSATTFTTGNGVLNVNGGSVAVSGTLKVWNTGSSSINVSAGTLAVGSIDTSGNPARLNFTGGTLDFTSSSLTISGAGPIASLSLTANKTLRVSGAGSTFQNAPGSVVSIAGGRLYGRDIDLTAGAVAFTSGTIEIDGGPLKIGASSATYGGAITGTGSLTKSGANSITLSGPNNFTGSTNVTAGSLVFNTPHLTSSALNVSDNATAQFSSGGANVLRTGTINTGATGRVDLGDNPAIIDYSTTDPIASIRAMIKSGYNNGSWNGPGIISSATQTSPIKTAIAYAEASSLFSTFPATFAGQEIDSTTIVLRYTVPGDADFSGKADILDFNRLALNFGKSNMTWYDGDFDYTGTIDILDFNLLAMSFGQTSPNQAPPQALQIFAAEQGAMVAIPLPAPVATGAIGLLLSMLAIWYRRFV
jgi:autotransporter-associated beta strand protein/T5SS/PEP-CTERM-associated repeat protein